MRSSVEECLIESFRGLKRSDEVPAELVDIAQAAYESFTPVFDLERRLTWPKSLLEKKSGRGRSLSEYDAPDPYDIMQALRQRGAELLPVLLQTRRRVNRQMGDAVQEKLRAIARPPRLA